MKAEVNRPCMVCGSMASRSLHDLRFEEHAEIGTFTIRECAGCGLLFNSPRLSDPEIERLYGGGYYVFQEPPAEAAERVAHLAWQTIGVASRYFEDRTVLEVGCAKGYLLELLRQRGWRVQGVELSPDAAAFGRERLGLSIFTGTIQQWVRSSGFAPVPVAVSTDVIEHVTDPRAFLAALHAAVRPGGWLVLGTPNADSDHRRTHGTRWLGFNPFHIVLFSRLTLGRLLNEAGFDVVEAYTYANDVPDRSVARSGWRDTARSMLRASGALQLARRARDALQSRSNQPFDPKMFVTAMQSVADGGFDSYRHSADGRHPRASSCRGDNLVLIARRI